MSGITQCFDILNGCTCNNLNEILLGCKISVACLVLRLDSLLGSGTSYQVLQYHLAYNWPDPNDTDCEGSLKVGFGKAFNLDLCIEFINKYSTRPDLIGIVLIK